MNEFQFVTVSWFFYLRALIVTDNKLFVTKEELCYIKLPNQVCEEYLSLLSEHKGADHITVYHAKYASNRDENEGSAICIFAYDTDIYILLCSIYRCRSGLYFCRGTSSTKTGITYLNFSALRDLVAFVQFKKREKHPWRSVNLIKLQAEACNFTNINTPPWVFFTFLKLYKCYQIAQRITIFLLLQVS